LSARAIRLSSLLRAAGVEPVAGVDVDPDILGTALDSRRVGQGDIFFAIRGFEHDGEAFAPNAIHRGARAVVAASPRPDWVDPEVAWVFVEQPRRAAGLISRQYYCRPDEALTLVGITGTNGKTTVTYLLEAIASAADRRVGRVGTVGYAFDGDEVEAPRTTPEAPELYRLLAEMRDRAIEIVAIEVSSHALALSRVEGARFALAAFLNLGRDHLDFHEDEADYFEAKARLFDGLGPAQHAVLPADSSHGETLRRRTRARVWTFGRSEAATVRLRDERCDIDGSAAVLETPAGALRVRSSLPGRFNLDNVAAAAACALALDLPAEAVAAGVRGLGPVPGRAEKVDRGQPFAVLVDYAHTEDALRSLLSWLRELSGGRLRVVFGCGGDRDQGKRFGMGRVAAGLADRLYLTSDNPRREDPLRIIDEIHAGVVSVDGGSQRCSIHVDREEAIRTAIAEAAAGDVIVVAGKGHETTQTIGERLLPFDDRVVAARALEERGWQDDRHADA
jgi:UDP-N-acetylmuramoyl-L-alanyl-D-glutamate--2,6-diaminopimelate ligase